MGERNFYMKKLFIGLFAAAALFSFGDGKVYNVDGDLKCVRFMSDQYLCEDEQVYTHEQLFGDIQLPTYEQAVAKPYDENQTINVPSMPEKQTVSVEATVPAKRENQGLLGRDKFTYSFEHNYVVFIVRVVPSASVTFTWEGQTVQPTRVEQGLATRGEKHLYYSFDKVPADTQFSYSVQVDNGYEFAMKEGKVRTKVQPLEEQE